MTAIKSLHINDQSTWRGGEQQVYYLLEGLRQRGHRAELVAKPESAIYERVHAAGIKAHAIRMRGEADLLAVRKIARLIAEERFDVVHMHTAHAHSLGCIACARNSRPLCIVSRRVINPIKKSFLSLASLKYRWRVDHFIAISKAVSKVLVDGGVPPDKVSVVHSGVEPCACNPDAGSIPEFDLGNAKNTIGAIGALARHKGYEYLVEAAPLILREMPKTKIFLVGDGPSKTSLQELASRLGVENAIILPGFRPDVGCFLERFDVFVAPSLMEGLNTSIIDAMMMSKPVVATDVGGIPEIVEHEKTGLLVPPGDSQALAEAILDILAQPEKAGRLALAGHKRAMENFTADRMVERTIAVYEDLLKNLCKI